MYTIIGADGRQYGPVSADQIRQWMSEGRVDGRTLVQPPGSTQWQPLANVPELMPQAPPPPISRPSSSEPRPPNLPARTKRSRRHPGDCARSFGIHKFILGYTNEGVIMLLVTLLTVASAARSCGSSG